jgi:phage FluMu protein Com
MAHAGYTHPVGGVEQQGSFEVVCPHCHKTFDAEPLEGGRAARYQGFKCPHCKLFVPLQRVADAGLSRDTDS